MSSQMDFIKVKIKENSCNNSYFVIHFSVALPRFWHVASHNRSFNNLASGEQHLMETMLGDTLRNKFYSVHCKLSNIWLSDIPCTLR